MGCSDPQGPARGRESINPAKMKLCPDCHNPFASGKLYNCLQRFFKHGDDPWDPKWSLGYDALLLQSKRTPAATRKPNHIMTKTQAKTKHAKFRQTSTT